MTFYFDFIVQSIKHTVSHAVETSCFHDYGQELTLSLLFYLEIGRKKLTKVMKANKYELNRQSNG